MSEFDDMNDNMNEHSNAIEEQFLQDKTPAKRPRMQVKNHEPILTMNTKA